MSAVRCLVTGAALVGRLDGSSGRATGWVPWTSLIVGTVASLAANIAVGGHDLIGRALAGWPTLSMLASVKLASGASIDEPAAHLMDAARLACRGHRPKRAAALPRPTCHHLARPRAQRVQRPRLSCLPGWDGILAIMSRQPALRRSRS